MIWNELISLPASVGKKKIKSKNKKTNLQLSFLRHRRAKGSPLFCGYINDLPQLSDEVEIIMYADDTVLLAQGIDASF